MQLLPGWLNGDLGGSVSKNLHFWKNVEQEQGSEEEI